MGEPDSDGNQSTCVVEYAILWENGTWTTEYYDIPIDMSEDDTAANEWAALNLMPYEVTIRKGNGEEIRSADSVVVYSWP